MPDTRAFPDPTSSQATEAFPSVVQQASNPYEPLNNTERAHYWLSPEGPTDVSLDQKIQIAQVYATLAVQDAIRDVTASMVRIGNTKKR